MFLALQRRKFFLSFFVFGRRARSLNRVATVFTRDRDAFPLAAKRRSRHSLSHHATSVRRSNVAPTQTVPVADRWRLKRTNRQRRLLPGRSTECFKGIAVQRRRRDARSCIFQASHRVAGLPLPNRLRFTVTQS